MRILLTNDDGIHAPGIEALYNALADADGVLGGPFAEEVWPVAPLEVQSASSHGITFKTPLMVSREEVSPRMSGLAVEGRPADCVKLAVCSLWPERFGPGQRPDLVVSGLNAGANVGINVIYSGTVAAALEAAFLGVPSVALSLHIGKGKTRFDLAARQARRVLEMLTRAGGVPDPVKKPPLTQSSSRRTAVAGEAAGGRAPHPLLGPHSCVSVNIPICEDAGTESPDPPIVVCPMNTHPAIDAYERRVSPGGVVYYWAAGGGLDFHGADPGTDVRHLFRGEITVTPLKYDLTDAAKLAPWREALGRP